MTPIVAALEKLTERIARLEKAVRKPPRTAWRPSEVADQTGISYKEVLELIKGGALGAIPVGRLYIVPNEELQRFLSAGIRKAA